MKIKKLFILIAASAFFGGATVSCGGGESSQAVDNDSIVSEQLADSLSVALGAFLGSDCQYQTNNLDNVNDYIAGFQMMVGQKYSPSKLAGMERGLFVAQQFANMEAQGIEINREIFLRQFRRYVQMEDLSDNELAQLYGEFQALMQEVNQVLLKREVMRGNIEVIQQPEESQDTPEGIEEVVEEESVQEEITADSPETSNATPSEEDVVQAPL